MSEVMIKKRDAIQAHPEYLNPNVKRVTEKLTLIDQSYAKGWNEAIKIYIRHIEKLNGPIVDLSSVSMIENACLNYTTGHTDGYAKGKIDAYKACAEHTQNGFLEFLWQVINPNEMEVYLRMYNAREVNIDDN